MVHPPLDGAPFRAGDRVWVTGGYDPEPDWLAGTDGYRGTITEIGGRHALIELDDALRLRSPERREGWADFGMGAAQKLRTVEVASGRWLVLTFGWVGMEWREPIPRLHVGLSENKPDLTRIPLGGGIGAWVESHATMTHLHSE